MEHCNNKATTDAICHPCWVRVTTHQLINEGYIMLLCKDSTMIPCGTFGEMCRKVHPQDVFNETQELCKRLNISNCSYKIASCVKYPAQLELHSNKDGVICSICIPEKRGAGCKYGTLQISISQICDWNAIVVKNPSVTDVEAVTTITCILTLRRSSEQYYKWLEVDRNNMTNEIVKQKLGL